MQVALALLAALAWGVGDFSLGRATKSVSPAITTLVMSTVGITVLVCALPFVSSEFHADDLALAAAAGAIARVTLMVLFYALARYRMSVVSPTAAATSSIVPSIFGFIVGDRIGAVALAGVVASILAIVLLGIDRDDSGKPVRAEGILLALLGGLGSAGFFIAIGHARPDSGLYPLIAALAGGSVTNIVVVITRRIPLRGVLTEYRTTIFGSLSYVVAALSFRAAAQEGTITIASVVASLSPAITVLLAIVLLRERLTRAQQSGLVVAGIGVALIAAG